MHQFTVYQVGKGKKYVKQLITHNTTVKHVTLTTWLLQLCDYPSHAIECSGHKMCLVGNWLSFLKY